MSKTRNYISIGGGVDAMTVQPLSKTQAVTDMTNEKNVVSSNTKPYLAFIPYAYSEHNKIISSIKFSQREIFSADKAGKEELMCFSDYDIVGIAIYKYTGTVSVGSDGMMKYDDFRDNMELLGVLNQENTPFTFSSPINSSLIGLIIKLNKHRGENNG